VKGQQERRASKDAEPGLNWQSFLAYMKHEGFTPQVANAQRQCLRKGSAFAKKRHDNAKKTHDNIWRWGEGL